MENLSLRSEGSIPHGVYFGADFEATQANSCHSPPIKSQNTGEYALEVRWANRIVANWQNAGMGGWLGLRGRILKSVPQTLRITNLSRHKVGRRVVVGQRNLKNSSRLSKCRELMASQVFGIAAPGHRAKRSGRAWRVESARAASPKQRRFSRDRRRYCKHYCKRRICPSQLLDRSSLLAHRCCVRNAEVEGSLATRSSASRGLRACPRRADRCTVCARRVCRGRPVLDRRLCCPVAAADRWPP